MALVVQALGMVDYLEAVRIQELLVAKKLAGDLQDYLVLVEHPPVYTLGRGADEADLRQADAIRGIPAFRVGRGGGVTFHGPGQMIAYPIVALRAEDRDIRRYVRLLESALKETCAEFGVPAGTHLKDPGVWVGDRKLASIGIGMKRWITFHGVALNVTTDLSYFDPIVPCRSPGLKMTNLAEHLPECPSVARVADAFVHSFRGLCGSAPWSECA